MCYLFKISFICAYLCIRLYFLCLPCKPSHSEWRVGLWWHYYRLQHMAPSHKEIITSKATHRVLGKITVGLFWLSSVDILSFLTWGQSARHLFISLQYEKAPSNGKERCVVKRWPTLHRVLCWIVILPGYMGVPEGTPPNQCQHLDRGLMAPPKSSFNTIHCYLPSWDSLKCVLYFPAVFPKCLHLGAIQDVVCLFPIRRIQ